MRSFRGLLSNVGVVLAAGAVGFAGVYGFSENDGIIERVQAQVTGECAIKGNISTSGERIYHVPGQRYYNDTAISLFQGERWFCSEGEARTAGWRRSKV